MTYAISLASAPEHQNVNLNIATLVKVALKESCNECKVYMPLDWKISEKTVVQPDSLVACKKIEKKYLDFAPLLTIEILSPSTAYKDRHEKFELYEGEGVKYYLIIDPAFKKVEIYELVEIKYQPAAVSPASFEFKLKDGCRFSVEFHSIWE